VSRPDRSRLEGNQHGYVRHPFRAHLEARGVVRFLAGTCQPATRFDSRRAGEAKDLDVTLFLGAGDREVDAYFLAISGIVSSMTRFSETLRLRQYPSLKLETRIFAGEDHHTVVPRIVGEGIRHLWAEEAARLPSSWPEPQK
jgi:hypothetical protein